MISLRMLMKVCLLPRNCWGQIRGASAKSSSKTRTTGYVRSKKPIRGLERRKRSSTSRNAPHSLPLHQLSGLASACLRGSPRRRAAPFQGVTCHRNGLVMRAALYTTSRPPHARSLTTCWMTCSNPPALEHPRFTTAPICRRVPRVVGLSGQIFIRQTCDQDRHPQQTLVAHS
jgi:hypothetical protein